MLRFLLACYLSAVPPRLLPIVERITIGTNSKVYVLRAMDEGTVTVVTPFECRSFDYPEGPAFIIKEAALDEGNYFVMEGHGAPVGSVIKGNVHCGAINLALEVHIVPAREASPRVDLAWSDKDKETLVHFMEEIRAADRDACDQQVEYWRENTGTELNYVLMKRGQQFPEKTLWQHGHADQLYVHVDRRTLWSDLTIVDFRVQNRETKQLVLAGVRVVGAPPSSLWIDVPFTSGVAQPPSNSHTGLWTSSTVLQPGETTHCSIAFPRGIEDHRVTLSVTAIGEETKVASVPNIEL